MPHPAHPEGTLAFWLRRRRLEKLFGEKFGYAGNFERPRAYEEKLQFRKLYGNHAFYAEIADKYRVRKYVADRIGERYLVPLLGAHDRLTPEILAPLPAPFIIKANHGCKWHRVVRNKDLLDIPAAVARFNRLATRTFGHTTGEYHYRLIPPKIVIEQLLLEDDGKLPADYCLHCYHGARGFDFAVSLALPGGHSRKMHCDRNWNIWDGDLTEEECRRYTAPPNFGEMVEVARALSGDFDYVRVDLYNLGGRIYFSELTITPAAGLVRVNNPERAAKRTEMWELAIDNPRLYRPPPTIASWFLDLPFARGRTPA